MIDQTVLPLELVEINCRTVAQVWEAIQRLRVRGAPAIGVAAAYGLVIGMQGAANASAGEFLSTLKAVRDELASSRPTAVNLFWALDRMHRQGESVADESGSARLAVLLDEARQIEAEDRAMCSAIGLVGAKYPVT